MFCCVQQGWTSILIILTFSNKYWKTSEFGEDGAPSRLMAYQPRVFSRAQKRNFSENERSKCSPRVWFFPLISWSPLYFAKHINHHSAPSFSGGICTLIPPAIFPEAYPLSSLFYAMYNSRSTAQWSSSSFSSVIYVTPVFYSTAWLFILNLI